MGYFNNRRNAGRAQERIRPKSDTGAARREEPLDTYAENSSKTAMLIDFSNPSDELKTERDFRMLQSMYPNAAKELLPYIEEECDRMEYDGSAMFDEYPDFTTIYRVQKKILEAVGEKPAGMPGGKRQNADDVYRDVPESTGAVSEREWKNADAVPKEDLIRVMLLQEMHRRRERRRSYR